MKRNLLLAVMILCLSILTVGCSNRTNQEEPPNNKGDNTSIISQDDIEIKIIGDIEYEILDMNNLHSDLETALGFIQEHRGYGIVKEEGKDIIVYIGAGEKPTLGYGIFLSSIEKRTDSIILTVIETQPKEGEMVGEALTYPSMFVRLTTDIRDIHVETVTGEALMDINAGD